MEDKSGSASPILIRQEDYISPTVDPESPAGMDWFYKLVLMSYPLHVSPVPPTELFRKQHLLSAWEYFFTHHRHLKQIWLDLHQGSIGYDPWCLGLEAMLAEFHPHVDSRLPHPSKSKMPRIGAAMLLHGIQRGLTLQPTEALETLLMNSDVDTQLPCGMLRPPGSAVYVTFGEKNSFDRFFGAHLEGAFCFERKKEAGRELSLVFTGRYTPMSLFLGTIVLDILDESTTLVQALADATERTAQYLTLSPMPFSPSSSLEDLDRLVKEFSPERLGYLAKLFLYMSLPEARTVPRNEWTDAKKRLKGLGPKKQAKMARKLEALYDRVEVGPERLPEFTGGHGHGEGYEVSPHWRRGHFRHQPCGPRNQERKLIFVQPMLVRADRLKGENESTG